MASADELLPAETQDDWRVFADDVVVVHATSEERMSPTKEELDAGEGFIPRVVHLAVDRTLWTRDGSPQPPSELALQLDGWTFHGTQETPLRFEGEPMIRVGQTYVMPIVYLTPGRAVQSPSWADLSVTAIIPASNGVLGDGDTLAGGNESRSAVVRRLWGEDVDAAGRLLRDAPLPAYASPYMALPPTDRYTAIANAKAGKSD
jgi:hypothetical protein